MPGPKAATFSRDTDWLWPSAICTASLGLAAITLMVRLDFRTMPDPVASLASWVGWTIMASFFAVGIYTVGLMRAGHEHPMAILREKWREHWKRYLIIEAGMVLAGLDMYFFMILKPELNVLFPFWADPALSQIDRFLLGTDGWRLFMNIDLEVLAWVYSPFWFFTVLLTLFWLLVRPASVEKNAAIVAYFLTWSIFGPVGQALLSAGGPIFYGRLGFGSDFDAMRVPQLTQFLSDYLWATYQTRSLAPGAGISAMPSLHIATMAWVLIVFVATRSRWLWAGIPLTAVIYMGSVALGWHYAIDGVVGAAGAIICFVIARALMNLRASSRARHLSGEAPVTVGAAAADSI